MTLADAGRVFIRFTSPRVLAITAAVAWMLKSVEGDWSRTDALVAGTILLLWPVQEWLLHVFVLHFRPFKLFGRTIDLLNAREHRKHHRDPWNLSLVFIPTFVFFYSIPVLWMVAHLAAPRSAVASIALAVYFTLSLHYEWAHYLAHIRYV
ncbi:MAG TPA: hypothetical protein VMT89_18280, partial [Candidatus Acidoferrales bacterium]|nr:hypothetical protein [Candidatus Acidoferrales bacterium]